MFNSLHPFPQPAGRKSLHAVVLPTPGPVRSNTITRPTMHVAFFRWVIGPALLMVSICDAHAGLLEETCHRVYEQFHSGPYERLTESVETFSNDKESAHGCVIRFFGNANNLTDSQRPDRLFGDPLPYCPGGKLPQDVPHNTDGWCTDEMADGPDSTHFRVLKKDVFCVIQGSWDGGDDSDPTYVPSTRYQVIVNCGIKK